MAEENTYAQLEKLRSELETMRRQNAARDAAQKEKDEREAEQRLHGAFEQALEKVPIKHGLKSMLTKTWKDDFTVDEEGRVLGPSGMTPADLVTKSFAPDGEWRYLLGKDGLGTPKGVEIDSIKPGANNDAARAEIARLTRSLLAR